jgi:hypothetical protein
MEPGGLYKCGDGVKPVLPGYRLNDVPAALTFNRNIGRLASSSKIANSMDDEHSY